MSYTQVNGLNMYCEGPRQRPPAGRVARRYFEYRNGFRAGDG